MKQQRYTVKPYERFGEILFDEPRDTVRLKLGTFKEFKKNKFSKNTMDDCGDILVSYDELDKVNAVQALRAEVYIGETKVFPCSKREFIAIISELDNTYFTTEDSVESVVLGICAYAPEDDVEALVVYRHGYYSK
jgi:hypothetical protein